MNDDVIGKRAWVIAKGKDTAQHVREIVIRSKLRTGYSGTFVDSGHSTQFYGGVYFDEHKAHRAFAQSLETKIARLERALSVARSAQAAALAKIAGVAS